MRYRILKKRYLITACIFLSVAILLLAAPGIARWYIEKNSMEMIGRRITIDRIGIRYLTGTLKVRGFKIFEADEKTVFASFRQLRISVSYLPLLRNEFVIRKVSLDDPFIQVMQNGSMFNFSDLVAPDSTETEKKNVRKTPAKYVIHNIRITGGFVKYTDVPLQHTISLDSIDLTIPGFTWNSDSARLGAGFRFVEGGGISSDLEINQADSTYRLSLMIDSLNLGITEPYVRNYLNVSTLTGNLTSDLMINGSISSILDLSVQGTSHVSNFGLQDTLGRTILSFNDLSVKIDTLDLSAGRLHLGSISLIDPFVLMELQDSVTNWSALMKTGESADSAAISADTTGTTEGFRYNIPEVSVSGGSILYMDKNLRYPFEYKIDSLKLNVKEITDQPGRISYDVAAGLNGTGKLITHGMFSLENPGSDVELSLDISRLRMKDLDAYFRHYFGFPVTGGTMNLRTDNKLKEKSLVSNNEIYFRRFSLGKKIADETRFNVPLRLALAVLSDRNGIIDLKAPVRMKGEEVRIVNLGKIIFRIIGNLFVKAAVSPINLLSGLIQSDPASFQSVRLNLTEFQPDEKAIRSLDAIAGILDKKPMLKADFIYCINRGRAADTLAGIMARKELMNSGTLREKDIRNIADSSLFRYLRNKLTLPDGTDSLPLAALSRLYFGEDVLSSSLDSLRAGHAGYLKKYLATERNIPAERFSIIEITPDSLVPVRGDPLFRIYFTAEDQ